MGSNSNLTVNLSEELAARVDALAEQRNRTREEIVSDALHFFWLADEDLRHELTLEALKSIDEGRSIPHEEIVRWAEKKKRR